MVLHDYSQCPIPIWAEVELGQVQAGLTQRKCRCLVSSPIEAPGTEEIDQSAAVKVAVVTGEEEAETPKAGEVLVEEPDLPDIAQLQREDPDIHLVFQFLKGGTLPREEGQAKSLL